MSKNKWSYNSVYDYLEQSGLIPNGDPEEIKKAKRRYWSKYKVHHRKERKISHPEFVIRFPKQIAEKIRNRAKKDDLSPQQFMSQIIHDAIGVEITRISPITAKAQLTLSLIYTEIQDYIRNYHASEDMDYKKLYEELLDKVQELEECINQEILCW